MLFQVAHSLPNGGNVLSLIVGDRHVELLFEFHDQLNRVERIGAQVVCEACFGSYFRGFYAKLVDDNGFFFSAISDISVGV